MQPTRSGKLTTRRALRAALVLAASFGLGSAAASAAVSYEGFDYSGTTLNGNSGGTGWSGGWIQTGTSASANLSNDSTSLTYPATWESPLPAPATPGRG